MSGQIFISYRREESRWSAGRLYDRLTARFDPKQIFMDIDGILLGDDFVEVIQGRVTECDILIAVIGTHWLTSPDEQGNRRLDNPEDFVRMEIATALTRGVRVIPVLVDGALIPRSLDLPDDLRPLVRRNALRISDTSFNDDCRRLISTIEQVLEKIATERPEREKKDHLEAERRNGEEKERREAERRESEIEKVKLAGLTGTRKMWKRYLLSVGVPLVITASVYVFQITHGSVKPPIASASNSLSTASTATPFDATWPDGRILRHPELFIKTRTNINGSDVLMLRSGPGIRFPIIGQIPADATDILAFNRDQVLDRETLWCPVEWQDFRGYIARSYLRD
jgi:TIR domain-containing protein